MGVAAGEKIPLAEPAPVIYGGNPSAGGLVLNIRAVVTAAFYFNDHDYAAGKPDKEIGFVNVGVVVQFVRDVEFQAVVADVTVNNACLRQLLKLEYGRLFP